jgi:hypothetical protein
VFIGVTSFATLTFCATRCWHPLSAINASIPMISFMRPPMFGTVPATVRSFRNDNRACREKFPMADDRDDTPREHTTVVETGGGGGGGAVLAVVLLIIVVLVLLYMFRGQLGLGGSKTTVDIPNKVDVNINHS